MLRLYEGGDYMRFCVELLLNKPSISKEKNKMIMHIMKLLFENTNEDMYKELYEGEENKEKNFSFSSYLGRGVKFNKDDIYIPDQKIILNFSTYDTREGILFYNSFVKNLGLEIPVEKNLVTINSIKEAPKGQIGENTIFTTGSPIVVRNHKGDNKKTWYYSLEDKEGYRVFMENLGFQLRSNLKGVKEEDIEEIRIRVLENKLVKVKHYGIVIPSNLGRLEISAKAYIVDYLYKAGIGSRRSQGFGYLNIG